MELHLDHNMGITELQVSADDCLSVSMAENLEDHVHKPEDLQAIFDFFNEDSSSHRDDLTLVSEPVNMDWHAAETRPFLKFDFFDDEFNLELFEINGKLDGELWEQMSTILQPPQLHITFDSHSTNDSTIDKDEKAAYQLAQSLGTQAEDKDFPSIQALEIHEGFKSEHPQLDPANKCMFDLLVNHDKSDCHECINKTKRSRLLNSQRRVQTGHSLNQIEKDSSKGPGSLKNILPSVASSASPSLPYVGQTRQQVLFSQNCAQQRASRRSTNSYLIRRQIIQSGNGAFLQDADKQGQFGVSQIQAPLIPPVPLVSWPLSYTVNDMLRAWGPIVTKLHQDGTVVLFVGSEVFDPPPRRSRPEEGLHCEFPGNKYGCISLGYHLNQISRYHISTMLPDLPKGNFAMLEQDRRLVDPDRLDKEELFSARKLWWREATQQMRQVMAVNIKKYNDTNRIMIQNLFLQNRIQIEFQPEQSASLQNFQKGKTDEFVGNMMGPIRPPEDVSSFEYRFSEDMTDDMVANIPKSVLYQEFWIYPTSIQMVCGAIGAILPD